MSTVEKWWHHHAVRMFFLKVGTEILLKTDVKMKRGNYRTNLYKSWPKTVLSRDQTKKPNLFLAELQNLNQPCPHLNMSLEASSCGDALVQLLTAFYVSISVY